MPNHPLTADAPQEQRARVSPSFSTGYWRAADAIDLSGSEAIGGNDGRLANMAGRRTTGYCIYNHVTTRSLSRQAAFDQYGQTVV